MLACAFSFLPHQAHAVCPSDNSIVLDRLETAKDAYIVALYDQVVQILTPLLRQECVEDIDKRQEARFFVGVALFIQNEQERAETFILDLLRADPDIEIGDGAAPAAALEFIETVRTKHKAELDKIRLNLDESYDGSSFDIAWVKVEITRNQLWINILPFGAGSFQNGDDGWGIFFAATQASALGVSLTGAIMVEAIRGDTFTFSGDEAGTARRWQLAQLIGAGTFAALYVWSVGHGLFYYQPVIRRIFPPQFERPEDISQRDEPAIQWSAFPLIGPDTLGLGIRATW